MSGEATQALMAVLAIALSLAVLSPILCWILPNRDRAIESAQELA
ncbi:hypothetical protein PN462_16220 [Spirulina sp. CS-785/01]|nr:hypothetical protein [Spirulina sp. CS-785/01]MDB9314659.1 hypothetical protein [Spirulina sp. CS-785/01]